MYLLSFFYYSSYSQRAEVIQMKEPFISPYIIHSGDTLSTAHFPSTQSPLILYNIIHVHVCSVFFSLRANGTVYGKTKIWDSWSYKRYIIIFLPTQLKLQCTKIWMGVWSDVCVIRGIYRWFKQTLTNAILLLLNQPCFCLIACVNIILKQMCSWLYAISSLAMTNIEGAAKLGKWHCSVTVLTQGTG
jgi:hypothetical protein